MNSDIKLMVELQEYWDNILKSRICIEKIQVDLDKLGNQIQKEKAIQVLMQNEIKNIKTIAKNHEIELADLGLKIRKLEERKKNVQNEKELTAVAKEIDKLRFDIGSLEEKIFMGIDSLDEKEKNSEEIIVITNEYEQQLETKNPISQDEIRKLDAIVARNEEAFNRLIDNLAPAYRSRFTKMLNSKDGKAIGMVVGEICGCCHYKIPASLAIEASRDDKVSICTNCGKFIYR
jgi:predicted  nucleic acid-binding Zn-ribbon protein